MKRSILAPIGYLYGRLMEARNAMFDSGLLKSFPLGARTISVGNITTGGTGKTPLVALIAETLIEHGETVGILTRGYGRSNERERVLVSDGEKICAGYANVGDEPLELAIRLNGRAVVVADADRVSAAQWAQDQFGITVFVLDDGFQHRRARRDLDIVCIDAMNAFGNELILPAGNLRERLHGLRRAGAVVITRADHSGGLPELEARVRELAPEAALFTSTNKIRSLTGLKEIFGSPGPEGLRLFAFSAIGNPDSFVRDLKESGHTVGGDRSFSDHRSYSQRDITEVEDLARRAGADALVTTAKDSVKLEEISFSMPCYVASSEVSVSDMPKFTELILGR